MANSDYDLCVIGGGVNGAGIARDAAGRGLSVLLVEAQDLAGATSSASTKLIHGGLRYLQYYEFKLVRDSLIEREKLLKIAPHIIWPLEFVLPHESYLRPAWMINIGLFLYDHLGTRTILPGSKNLNLREHKYGAPLQSQYRKGFSYADCWADDARLVILNALDAQNHGAKILTRTACTNLVATGDQWEVSLQSMLDNHKFKARAKTVVNASGPWVGGVLKASSLDHENTPNIRLVKGSHIIISRLFEGEQAYILQQPDDGRIIFAIPYEKDFTLIGTTEVSFNGDPTNVDIEEQEINYLCKAINRSFNKAIKPKDVVYAYSGVRPLIDDGSDSATSTTRSYKIQLDETFGPKLINIFGGKLTTYRKLSEQAVNLVSTQKPWTDKKALPGGNIEYDKFNEFTDKMLAKYDWLPKDLIYRYVRAYGTITEDIVSDAKSIKDMGRHFGNYLYEREVHYLIEKEWAWTSDDILWRRSKLGLHVKRSTIQNLKSYMAIAQERVYAT